MGTAVSALGLLLGLERAALKVVATFIAVLLLALAFGISSLMTFFAVARPGEPIESSATDAMPSDQLPVMQAAAGQCRMQWQILAGVAKVESDFGRNMATSSAGAIGYGQFLPSSWEAYGQGGDPYDFHDALPAMARYLCAAGAATDPADAIYAYNHAGWYVDEVLAAAVKYGYVAPGSDASKLLEIARSQTGKPYVWGGASPLTSFDCSGLVQWSYRQVGVPLPRTAQEQFNATQRVDVSQLRPGDLVFFQNTYASANRITHVGIYVGAGRMLNAPSSDDVIHEMDVFSGYWASHYAGAGRVPGLL